MKANDMEAIKQALLDALGQYIINMVDAAVKEERKACAEVCEELSHYNFIMRKADASARDCAFAIRERGAPSDKTKLKEKNK